MRTERELKALGEMIFEGLKSGSLAIQNATDQAAVTHKSYATIEDIVGIVLHGNLPHEFQVAVVQAWKGSPKAVAVIFEAYRDLFVSELLRLVPHEDDVVLVTRDQPRHRDRF